MTEKEMAEALSGEGWGVTPPEQYRIDIERCFTGLWEDVKVFTMTSMERGYSLYKSVEYLCRNGISGDFVECGVWKGGSCMLMAKALLEFGEKDRDIYLFDTFTGMTPPTEEDVIAWNNIPVLERWRSDGHVNDFCTWAVEAEEVEKNMKSTGYDPGRVHLVPGDILETIESRSPDRIALLRLDTDWYASTAKELAVLYPRLVRGGVCVIDDYGHFKGARKAVDEYFADADQFPLLSRADYTGRVLVKP